MYIAGLDGVPSGYRQVSVSDVNEIAIGDYILFNVPANSKGPKTWARLVLDISKLEIGVGGKVNPTEKPYLQWRIVEEDGVDVSSKRDTQSFPVSFGAIAPNWTVYRPPSRQRALEEVERFIGPGGLRPETVSAEPKKGFPWLWAGIGGAVVVGGGVIFLLARRKKRSGS